MTTEQDSTASAPGGDKMLARIRALLNKAENEAATPAEAEAFTAKATELIAKYGIDQALLAAELPAPTLIGDRVFVVEAPYAGQKLRFLFWIATALGAQGVRRTGTRQGTEELHLFGTQADLTRIDLLFTSLLVQCANAMTAAYNADPRAMARPRKWRGDFTEGFADQVSHRLKLAESRAQRQAQAERAPAGGPSVELVLLDKTQRVSDRLSEVYPNLKAARSRRVSRSSGYSRGSEAGSRADLGGTRFGSGTRGAVTHA